MGVKEKQRGWLEGRDGGCMERGAVKEGGAGERRHQTA